MLRRRSGKRFLVVGLFIAVVTTAAVVAVRCAINHQPYFGLYLDDALYVVTAKSLADGSGYRIISLPSSPFQTKYPILYPFILSLLWRLQPKFPDNVMLLQSSGVAFGFAFAALSVLYLRKTRRITSLMSVVIFAATVLNIKFLSFLPFTMSDFLYGSVTVIALWLAEAAGCARSRITSPLAATGLGAAAALSALVRSVGGLVGPVVVLYLLIVRKYKTALLAAAGFIACLFPYWWWQHSVARQQPAWLAYYTDYGGWASESYSKLGASLIWDKLHDMFTSVLNLVWPLIDHLPYQTMSTLVFFLVYRGGFLLLWAGLFIGMKRDLWNHRRCLLPIYVLGYGIAMIIWPGFTEWRLVLVVLPFIYYFYFCAFRDFSRLVKSRLGQANRSRWQALCAVAAVLFSSYLVLGAAWSSVPRAGHYPKLLPWRPDISAEIENKDILDTYRWIRTNTASGDVFVCNNESVLWLHTGRQAVEPSGYEGWRLHTLDLVTPDTVTATLKGSDASYLLLDPSPIGAYQVYVQFGAAVKTLLASRPGLLTLTYTSPHGVMVVFRVNGRLLDR